MVSILPNQRSPFDLIGSAIGQNLQQVLPGAVQQGYNRGQLQNNLGQLSGLAQSGASPLDITLAAMQAGAGIPGSERYLGQIIPMLQQLAAANASQKVGFGQGNQAQPRTHEPIEPLEQRQQLPNFAGQPNQNFPTNIGPQNAPGNLPQAATTGQVLPLRTPDEKRRDSIAGSKKSTAEGLPLTPKEYLEQFINPEEADKKLHNETVESERKQRIASQQNYGEKAVEKLKKVFPEATDEQQAIFEKKGEKAAGQGKSEAEINQYLAKEAVKFKNVIAGVKSDLSAPRSYNAFHRKFLGSKKDFDEASKDLRSQLKPILDLGLYDTARNLLSEQGYYPEERESIINPMSERQQIAMNKIPQVKRIFKPGIGGSYDLEKANLNNVKEGLQELKKIDPNFSLVLARKAFEDKNYDWRQFKDVLNELESEGFELTDDQKSQRETLNTPPLNTLEKILEGLNLQGR